jgi:tetratricopeptide (TPR) repeat protein
VRKNPPPALLLFGFAVLLYANTLSFQYAHDDTLVIIANRFTRRGFGGIGDILYHDSFVGFLGEGQTALPGGRYRPLAQVWFAVEYGLFGLNPFIGHLANVLLYGGLGVLLYFTLRRLFNPPEAGDRFLSVPFVATALFLAHPLHTEVVANIKGRDEILGLLFSLATLWFVLRHVDTRRIRHLALAGAMFLLALLSKENAAAFLAVVPLTLSVFTAAGARERRSAAAALAAGLAVYLLAFRIPALGFLVGATAGGQDLLNNPFADATVGQRYATVMKTWLIYLRLLIFPHPLTHDYYPDQIPLIGWNDVRALAALALYGAAAIFAFLRIRGRSLAAYGILFFLLTFLPQSNLAVSVGTLLGERFMFVPSLAFCGGVAWLIAVWLPGRIRSEDRYRAVAAAVLALLLSAYAGKSFTRSLAWKDDFTLFTTDARTSTNSARANVMAGDRWLGKALEQQDAAAKAAMLDNAVAHLTRGVGIHPRYLLGWILLGNAYRHRKDYALSRASFEQALKVDPGNIDALTYLRSLGQSCIDDGQWGLAAEAYLAFLGHQPGHEQVTVKLALCYANLGRAAEAVALLNRVLAGNPRSQAAYSALGRVYGKFLNDLPRALEALNRAYEINQTDALVLENLGVVYALGNDFERAVSFFAAAVAARPEDPELHNKLGNAYLRLGRKELARLSFAKMLELQSKRR